MEMTLPSRSTESENNQLEHAAHTTDTPSIQSLSIYEHKDREIERLQNELAKSEAMLENVIHSRTVLTIKLASIRERTAEQIVEERNKRERLMEEESALHSLALEDMREENDRELHILAQRNASVLEQAEIKFAKALAQAETKFTKALAQTETKFAKALAEIQANSAKALEEERAKSVRQSPKKDRDLDQ